MANTTTHLTLFPCPGLGHLIPFLEFAKHILAIEGFKVSLLVIQADASAIQSKLLCTANLPKGLSIIDIPSVDVSSYVDDEAHIITRISVIVRESLPLIESVIAEMTHPTVLVVDLFATAAWDIVADNLCAKKYMLFAPCATALAFMMYLPTLHHQVDGQFVHLDEPVRIPGCNPIHVEDLIEPVRDRTARSYTWFLNHVKRFPMANGILVNTCEYLEAISLRALREDPIFRQIPTPSVYPVGPIVSKPAAEADENQCIKWLDMQPNNSVLFVSFGSGGTLSAEQMTELTWGLELSQQRFLWIVKKPFDDQTAGTFFSVGREDKNPSEYLPSGFTSRIKDVGLLVSTWAPQVEILAHSSTGGFLSHCGWNSTLESLVHGVPMIVWPLYAEQNMNAKILADELGVAVRPRVDREENGKAVVRREEIERVVRLVMEDNKQGNVMRGKAKEIKDGISKALDHEGGSSFNSLSQILEEWKINYHSMAYNMVKDE
ncbi:hydroquinone glucosyltransferase [Ranunculus cassubicifolius]